MKRIIVITFCSLLLTISFGSEIKEDSTDTFPNMSATILSFYRAYITEADTDIKIDSILSKYCTKELKDFLIETLHTGPGYDFVLDGWVGSDIVPNSVSVIKQNDRYKVNFKASQYPISDELVNDSLYIKINKDKKISHIIRPVDNYTVPHN